MTKGIEVDFSGVQYIVVGAGFFGATLAERIANDLEQPVLVLESRGHVGGNSYSEIDTGTGIEIHRYGSHIFHTRDQTVWDYVNRFSSFNHYRHKVLTKYQGQIFFMPINLDTINRFYDLSLSPEEAREFLAQEASRERIVQPMNFEEKAVSQIGRPLYEAFIRGYTIKQWGVSPEELPESIINRLPIRTDYNVQYFDDPFQGIPTIGYGKLFAKMLENPLITVWLNADFFQMRAEIPATATLIFSGAIDKFFDYRFGELSWRGLRFDNEIHAVDDFQGTAVMNYAEESVPYTRIHEFKHYHPERSHGAGQTLICKEYPDSFKMGKEPFYPINTAADKRTLQRYLDEAKEQAPKVIFGGRLGSYKYYDMDQVIREALELYEKGIKPMVRCHG